MASSGRRLLAASCKVSEVGGGLTCNRNSEDAVGESGALGGLKSLATLVKDSSTSLSLLS